MCSTDVKLVIFNIGCCIIGIILLARVLYYLHSGALEIS